jgi:hypothetical protein
MKLAQLIKQLNALKAEKAVWIAASAHISKWVEKNTVSPGLRPSADGAEVPDSAIWNVIQDIADNKVGPLERKIKRLENQEVPHDDKGKEEAVEDGEGSSESDKEEATAEHPGGCSEIPTKPAGRFRQITVQPGRASQTSDGLGRPAIGADKDDGQKDQLDGKGGQSEASN